MWLPVRYTSMVSVCQIHTFLHPMWCWYACLACFVPPIWLSLLLCFLVARLPTCSCMSLCVVHTSIQWVMHTRSKPAFFLLGHYLFVLKTRFFASLCASHVCLPHLASFPSLSLACLSFCLFLCLSTSLFLLSLHDGARILGARCDLLGGSKKGKMQARRCKPTKGNVQ